MSVQALQQYTRVSRYAKFIPEKNRRETWPEQVERVMGMHRVKFADVLDKIQPEMEEIEQALLRKEVLGSQRALQFGGPSILKINTRMYNCTVSYIDRPRVFQEVMFVLLCGCGAGFSVQTHHIAKLPDIQPINKNDTIVYQIPDSIEGWSDAIGVLFSSYFSTLQPFPEYAGKNVIFDYALIRPAGAPLSHGGKAPGPNGLRASIEKIRDILDNAATRGRIKSIEAYDSIMHISDSVLSGGIRRSATICIFSPDDIEMATAKTGEWFITNPQRGRSNNSAMLVRNQTTPEQFTQLMQSVKEFGEPGFVWGESTEIVYNPCFERNTRLATDRGLVKITDLMETDNVVVTDLRAGKGSEYDAKNKGTCLRNATAVKCTGKNRPIYKIITSHGYEVAATEYHEFPTPTGRKKLSELKVGDTMLLQSGKGVFGSEGTYSLGYDVGREMCEYGDSSVPDWVWSGTESTIRGFLRGYMQVFGDIGPNGKCPGIVVSGADKNVCSQIQQLLLMFGVISKQGIIGVNGIESSNMNAVTGDPCITITGANVITFAREVGLVGNKGKQLSRLIAEMDDVISPERYITKIKSIEYWKHDDVFCLTQPGTNTVVANGIVSGQCAEIGMCPVDPVTSKTGWQFCNLCEINMKKVTTKEEFFSACRVAAILGTLQAAYTNFEYLGPVTERIVRQEALLGVSMTGMMDSPDIAFDPEIQRAGAKIVLDVNAVVAAKIGINISARTTCIKPAGTTSCILGSSSGIHPHHARRYIRHVQANKLEPALEFFMRYNPKAVEESCWSNNKTDMVIKFLCEVPPGSVIKNQVNAITLLEKVMTTQQNWVEAGTRVDVGLEPWLRHNVSNTITVQPNEWEDVEKYIYDNRQWFAGISLLPASGDKDYAQAPFTAVLTPVDIVKTYGDGSLFASGVIEDAVKAYSGLWEACASLLETGAKPSTPEQIAWIERAQRFASKYFTSHKDMTYCLKDVYNWKQWIDLSKEYKDVPWEDMYETKDDSKGIEIAACAGGKCELF